MGEVVDDVASRLWPGRVKSIEVLAHGITNSNFVVDLGDERVVVRVPGANTQLLGIDRTFTDEDADRLTIMLKLLMDARKTWQEEENEAKKTFAGKTPEAA